MVYVWVATPLKTTPLNSSAPVASPWWIDTLCGTPASLLSNWIWNEVSALTVTAVCSYLIPSALIWSKLSPPPEALGPAEAAVLGMGVIEGAGTQVQPALAVVQAATSTRDRI